MTDIIAANTSGGVTNWSVASNQYFNWFKDQPSIVVPLPHVDNAAVAQPRRQQEPDFRSMRLLAEETVRGRMLDPESARFEWPRGFMGADYKPFLQPRVNGWVTCGFVNSRNRMGGYVGRTPFVIVLDRSRTSVAWIEIGTQKDFDLTSAACSKMLGQLPPAPAEMMMDAPPALVATASSPSVADELTKLAALKDRGVLTQAEFNQQKAALLNR